MRTLLTLSACAMHAVAFAANKDAGSAPAAPKADAAATKEAPKIVSLAAGVSIPPRSKPRGPGSQFPFDGLAVGGAFGVADRTAKSLQTIIGNQNRKHMVDKTDANGSIVYKTKELKGADGSVTMVPTTDAERVASKRFYAVDVNPADYDGASVLVVREA